MKSFSSSVKRTKWIESKSVYVWNVLGGVLNAGQSALILMVISRTSSIEDSGIYSLAYAIASLALTLGLFGVRHYQASDVKEKYKFEFYYSSRVLTIILMCLLITYYLVNGYFFKNYSPHKCLTICLVGLLKVVDAFEDVFHGRLQQKQKLKTAAKSITIRYIFILLFIVLSLLIFHNINISIAVGLLVSLISFSVSFFVYRSFLGVDFCKIKFSFESIKLLSECFAVAVGNFVMIYIANAPKYAIDKYMNETIQTYFNYIFMPVYVISTLCLYIFQPSITKMSKQLEKNNISSFYKSFWSLIVLTLFVCFCVLIGGMTIGIPVLNFLYNTDLSLYKDSFFVLLIGGCILAFSVLFSVCIIIIRQQKYLLVGYLISALASFFASDLMVKKAGITGASFLYLFCIAIQAVIFFVIMIIGFTKVKKRDWKIKQEQVV